MKRTGASSCRGLIYCSLLMLAGGVDGLNDAQEVTGSSPVARTKTVPELR
jgi:hypothetical protein